MAVPAAPPGPQVIQAALVKMDYIFMEALVAVTGTAGLRGEPVLLLLGIVLAGVLGALRAVVAVAVRVIPAAGIPVTTQGQQVTAAPEVAVRAVEEVRAVQALWSST
jgi:hypothetical protein